MIESEKVLRDCKGQILSLLPEAGSAGLATSYFKAKSRYGFVPSQGEECGIGNWLKYAFIFVFDYGVFLGSLGAMGYLFWDLFHSLKATEITTGVAVFRFLMATPLAIIASFGWSSIQMKRRLYEEYNYKQRVMELYKSFKEEIEETEGEESTKLKEELLTIMLSAVRDKPSLATEKSEKNPLPAFFGIKTEKREGGNE